MSAFGVMFASDQRAVAVELARVTGPVAGWRCSTDIPGAASQSLQGDGPLHAAAPECAGNPFAWGDRDRIVELLGDAFELRYEEGDCP